MSQDIPVIQITQSELAFIIKKHQEFLSGRHGGARAALKFRNLSGLKLSKVDLSYADFTGSIMIDADLSGGKFEGACFFGCDLTRSKLQNANFHRADLRGACLVGANLSGADLQKADLREGKLLQQVSRKEQVLPFVSGGPSGRAKFSGSKLADTKMSGAMARQADFSDANLSGAIMQDADLANANFESANLSHADFTGANLSFANMRQSIMAGTVLDAAETQGIDQTGALTKDDTGERYRDLGTQLPDLLESHTTWISTAGQKGQQLNLSGFDLRDILDLKRYTLTAMRAVETNFVGLDLRGIQIQSAMLDQSDFRDCLLTGADLRGSTMRDANFSRSEMTGINLSALHFKNADGSARLQKSDLTHASFRYAVIQNAQLSDALFTRADFSNAILIGCNLKHADLSGANMTNTTLRDCDMEGAVF